MKKTMIFKAMMALIVIMLGVNFNADAQLGGLINAAKNKAKQNKAQKEQAELTNKTKPVIPQPDAGGSTVIFTVQDTAVAMWNPATLELTITTTKGGNTPGSILKVDASTGKVTDKNGASKGSISNDGTIVSPNLGNLKLVTEDRGMFGLAYHVKMGNEQLGTVDDECIVSGKLTGRASSPVSTLLTAYVYYGLMLTNKDYTISKLGYDPDKKYTSEELDDMIEWNDEDAISAITKYENSMPCFGFKETHPEFKNAKIGGVGLLANKWREYSDGYGIRYWIVYELTDGRNIVTFSRAFKKWTYGEVIQRDDHDINNTRHMGQPFNEVTDWVRK